jgi:hypothetical protein
MVAYSVKERFIAPIEVGLGLPITGPASVAFPAPKLQTIRAVGKRRHARPGEIIQIYYAMRTSFCRLIGVARCVDVVPLVFDFAFVNRSITARIDGQRLRRDEMDDFARRDGFDDHADMARFWRDEHPFERFEGVLIRWAPITGEP